MVIAGNGTDRAQLERQAAELGLREVVDFIGWVAPDKVPELINSATIVLMPSRWEGLPSVALQASMMARPVLATSVGGLPEVVVHGETGLLVCGGRFLARASAGGRPDGERAAAESSTCLIGSAVWMLMMTSTNILRPKLQPEKQTDYFSPLPQGWRTECLQQ